MAFTEHPEFSAPEGGDALIWRYLDLAKFLSLLEKEALFFVRLDKLQDPFEGYYTTANLLVDQLQYDELPDEWKTAQGFPDEQTFNAMRMANQQIRYFVKRNREVTFVNCWYAQEYESAAMWSQYLKSNEGIAIRSSYKHLIESLAQYEDYEVHIGLVQYLDYNREAIPMGNLLTPFLCKRKSFEHERELRCLIWTPQHGKNTATDPAQNKYKDETGLYVPISLDALIQEVYVSPTAPSWLRDLVEKVVFKFGLKKPVVQSALSAVPVY